MTKQRLAFSIFIFTFISLFSAGGSTPPAYAQLACRSFGPSPNVTFHIELGKLVVSNGHSRTYIKNLTGRRLAASGLGPRWRPVGLTTTERQFSIRVKVRAQRIEGKRFCGQLSKVDARLGYDKLKVYIAREYRAGTCHYRAILDHENRHVTVFRDTLVKFAPRVQRRLRRTAKNLGPIVASSADKIAIILQKKLHRELKPLFREMDREMDFQNAKLDTPQNYQKEQARCPHW